MAETRDLTKEPTDPPTAVPPRAGRREWLGLAVLALPTILLGLDMTVLHLAAPMLSADLAPSSSQLLWIVDVYGFVVAGLLITMGTIGDRIGRRRLLMIGAAGFAVASVLAAFATSAALLIAARALLGLAGATLMPSTLSLISNMFRDPRQRQLAIAIWMTNFMIGGMAGPLIGGALLANFHWGSVFLIGVPPLLLLLALARPLLPEFRHPGAGRIDLISVALSTGAIVAVVYGLKETAKDGLHLTPLAVTAVGALAGYVFARRQLRLTEPLLDLRLFRRAAFSVSLGAQTFGLYVLAAMQFLLIQYLQLVLGMSPLEAGLWTLPSAVAGIAGTLAAPFIARRLPARIAMTGGFLLALPGLALMAVPGRTTLVAGLTVASVGIQVVLALTYDLIVGSAPPERAGVASGMGETGTEFGMALGVAVAGSLVTAVYRGQVTEQSLPTGVPTEARETLGSAVAIAEQLPGPLARELLDLSRAAYTDGVQLAALVSAGILAVLAVATATLLRAR
ncbi:DHA2 family multidrug resistance protein-like MFS transporter [Kribbella amoyensis]|uniref:DHA2 family multidrug resistance protein-like MFS transporter n=1 Tax=Kribbella amoyensis TaxID=996641 RepID=A0A561B7F3_9ACTN|nr:MFS transporter [Kribbella amoyensis]TWD74763.1 DHA2 family multidrug resistance protein-like MFS transporter [Kribbella amoyensis]